MVHYLCNHVKLGVSPRILYCVENTSYGLGGYLGIADLDCQKVKNIKWLWKIQTESHNWKPIVWTTNSRSGFPFPMRFARGRLEFVIFLPALIWSLNLVTSVLNSMGFGQASLSGACRGYMPPLLKTNKWFTVFWLIRENHCNKLSAVLYIITFECMCMQSLYIETWNARLKSFQKEHW